MKVLLKLRLLTVVLLALFSAASCAQTPSKTDGDSTPEKGVTFKPDERGMLIPYAADGTPFKSCGTNEKNTCSLYNEKVTVNDIKQTVITGVTHSINPVCLVYLVSHGGMTFMYFDPTDPDCAIYME